MNSKKNKQQSQNGLRILWLNSAVKTIESNWAKRSQLGSGSSWAWPILTRSQTGPRSQDGSEQYHQQRQKNVKQFHNQFLQLLSKSLVYTSTKVDIEMEILSDTEKALHQSQFISIHRTLENKSSWRKSCKNLISLLYLPFKLKGGEFMKE